MTDINDRAYTQRKVPKKKTKQNNKKKREREREKKEGTRQKRDFCCARGFGRGSDAKIAPIPDVMARHEMGIRAVERKYF